MRAALYAGGLYLAADLGERGRMQNQPYKAAPDGLGRLNLPAIFAHPKFVLPAAGVVGLALDLFVRPLSWVALALIVFATAPWLLQAWSQRSAPLAKAGHEQRPASSASDPAGKPRSDQRAGPSGAAVARPEQPPVPARDTPRPVHQAEPPTRQPPAPRAAEPERRPPAPRPAQGRVPPPGVA